MLSTYMQNLGNPVVLIDGRYLTEKNVEEGVKYEKVVLLTVDQNGVLNQTSRLNYSSLHYLVYVDLTLRF